MPTDVSSSSRMLVMPLLRKSRPARTSSSICRRHRPGQRLCCAVQRRLWGWGGFGRFNHVRTASRTPPPIASALSEIVKHAAASARASISPIFMPPYRRSPARSNRERPPANGAATTTVFATRRVAGRHGLSPMAICRVTPLRSAHAEHADTLFPRRCRAYLGVPGNAAPQNASQRMSARITNGVAVGTCLESQARRWRPVAHRGWLSMLRLAIRASMMMVGFRRNQAIVVRQAPE